MGQKNIVSAKWLHNHLDQPDLVIVDARFQLGQPEKGYQSYQQEHIPGAVFMDMETDLSAPVREHGGRHPLPTLEEFVQRLSRTGIDSSKMVVIYDDQGGAMAARLWWMLKYVGHDRAVILEEGFSQWKEQGYPTTSKVTQYPHTQFVPDVRHDMLVTMQEVREKLDDDNVLLIDSRSAERYWGENEKIDPVAGHIPGAINEDWQNRLGEDRIWKTKEDQNKDLHKYVQLKDKEMILYCGSGITACANVLAFDEIGLQPKLYAGGWSDWITYPENPVRKGKEDDEMLS